MRHLESYSFCLQRHLPYTGYPYSTPNTNCSDLGNTSHPPRSQLLILRDGDALPETLDLEVLSSGPMVDVLDVIGGGLEVAGSVVALREENVALGPRIGRFVDGNRRSLRNNIVRNV